MKLYIGGAYQGQEALARRENPGAVILPDFHETVRRWLSDGKDVRACVDALCCESADAIIVANEIGCGVVPMSAEDRAWRESVGRALSAIAQASESVTRVSCGIGVRIK